MKIFKLNDRFKIELDKVEIQLYKEFREIVSRDKKSEGDADGRKKYKAIKELTYVYHVCDYRSECRQLPSDKVEAKAIELAGLEPDWKPDTLIKAAIDRYKELQQTRSLRALEAIQSAMDKTIKFYQDFKPVEIDDIKKIMTAPADIAKANKAINELEEQIRKELSDEKEIRGGAEKGVFEDAEE